MLSTVTTAAIWVGDGKTEDTQKIYSLIPETEEFRAMQPSSSEEKNTKTKNPKSFTWNTILYHDPTLQVSS